MTTYNKTPGAGFLRLEAEYNGQYGYLLIDDNENRLLLDEGDGGRHDSIFTKVAK
jgi:hypothetical protein